MEPNIRKDTQPAFSMRGITKIFGAVVANEAVDFEVLPGEIHALLGENGSGKSTLMNVLSGIYRPDEGQIEVNGEIKDFRSPGDAIDSGIGMIHQHFKLAEAMTATDNIVAGMKKPPKNSIKKDDVLRANILRNASRSPSKTHPKINEFSSRFGIEFDPSIPASQLSVSQKQSVEIIKVLLRGANILILDEPTAVLTPQEAKKLFVVLRKMASQGCAIVFISHKLNEIMTLCDRVTVLRKGKSIETCNVSDIDAYDLVEKMVGRKINLSINKPDPDPKKQVCLEVKGLTYSDSKAVPKLDNLSFTTYYGEVLGVAGLAGGGQKELCESIAGIIRPQQGEIMVDEERITGLSPRDITQKGVAMCFIPEDRLGMGLVASMGIDENILLKEYALTKGPLIRMKDVEKKAEKIIKELDIKTPGLKHPVRMLSGGNIQKVILGREIHLNPKLMIAAYAVRGLDIHSSYTIYNLLNEQKQKNVSVLYIGEDLDVLIDLCDRIMVLCQGKNMGIVDSSATTKEEIGQMMSGTTLEELRRGVSYV